MKLGLLFLAVVPFTAMSQQAITLDNAPLGSGQVGKHGKQNAESVGHGMYHAPQYMPGYPTAATIWPRAFEIPCDTTTDCSGYNWLPSLGRAEYLFVIPRVKQDAPLVPPVVIREEIAVPFVVEREVIREVIREVKKIRE
jgi:hypothetical protein